MTGQRQTSSTRVMLPACAERQRVPQSKSASSLTMQKKLINKDVSFEAVIELLAGIPVR